METLFIRLLLFKGWYTNLFFEYNICYLCNNLLHEETEGIMNYHQSGSFHLFWFAVVFFSKFLCTVSHWNLKALFWKGKIRFKVSNILVGGLG